MKVCRKFSKYQKVTSLISSRTKKKQAVESEPIIKFKPKTIEFYKSVDNEVLTDPLPYEITPKREIPSFLHLLPEHLNPLGNKETPAGGKISKVAIWGPSNSGKSFLFNNLVGRYISAVSNKSFTTDSIIKGVMTDEEKRSQIIYYDLPGFSINPRDHNDINVSRISFDCFNKEEVRKVLLVVDSNKRPTKEVACRLNEFRKNYDSDIRPSLVINKIDLCFNRRKLMDIVSEYEGLLNFEKTFYTSALTQFGDKDINDFITSEAMSGFWEYNIGVNATDSEVTTIHEVIKGCIYEFYYKEIPYQLHFELYEFTLMSTYVSIKCKINCKKQVQKSIIIGRNGKNLENLRVFVEKTLVRAYGRMVQTEFYVAVGDNGGEAPMEFKEAGEMEARSEVRRLRESKNIKSIIKK